MDMAAKTSNTQLFEGWVGNLGKDREGDSVAEFKISIAYINSSQPLIQITQFRLVKGEVEVVEYRGGNFWVNDMIEYGTALIMRPHAAGKYLDEIDECIARHESIYSA